MQFLSNFFEGEPYYPTVACIIIYAIFLAILAWKFGNGSDSVLSSPPEQTSTDTGGDWAAIFPWIFWIGLMVFIGWLNN